ncbi:MAG TPA: hypothetical protein VMU77_06265 [Acidimicrobiales bacterium]|nr:hypothetical protein [Acidimicrobiales bacterium]
MSESGWDNSTNQTKLSTKLTPAEASSRLKAYLHSKDWNIESGSELSGGTRFSATKWDSRSAQLTPVDQAGRRMLGAWALLGRYPTGVELGGMVLAQYRYTINVWILASGDKTVIDLSVSENIDPFSKSVPDKSIFALNSRLEEHNPVSHIKSSLGVEPTRQERPSSVKIVSITASGPQLAPAVTRQLLKVA